MIGASSPLLLLSDVLYHYTLWPKFPFFVQKLSGILTPLNQQKSGSNT